MPLVSLGLQHTQITDLTPLKGMPLKHLNVDFRPQRDSECLHSISTLEEINNQPIAEFWKDITEASDPAKTLKAPAFQQWLNDIAGLPVDQQVEAVAKKLKELNPGFDGKVTHKIEFLDVTELQFVTDSVTDISPVRALPKLKSLICSGTSRVQGNWPTCRR